jgi:ribosomal protein S18 acetylase RimI-like enzyme
MRLVDVGVDSSFTFTPDRLTRGEPVSAIRAGTPDDIPVLQQLSAGAFTFTRFSLDPFFSTEQVNAFYAQWVNNLFEGLADVVFVYELEGQPVGFVSCSLHGDEGRIPLVAARSDQRGRGVGRELVRTALAWFTSAGTRVAHVKTQAANYPALALYHRSGFTISKTELTFSVALREATSRSR